MAAGIVLTKSWGRPDGVGLLAFTGWQLAVGGLVIGVFGTAYETTWLTPAGLALLGLGWVGFGWSLRGAGWRGERRTSSLP